MKTENLRRYFDKIKEGTKGDESSFPGEIIDYSNGNSISIEDIKEEYYKYLELIEEIDDYVESNDLDDCLDSDKIKEHFASKIDDDLFMINQACLRNFTDYMITKINKHNENLRSFNMVFAKNGNGFPTTRITVPVPWTRKLGFSENDKRGCIEIKNNEIIIRKEI